LLLLLPLLPIPLALSFTPPCISFLLLLLLLPVLPMPLDLFFTPPFATLLLQLLLPALLRAVLTLFALLAALLPGCTGLQHSLPLGLSLHLLAMLQETCKSFIKHGQKASHMHAKV
jgi:hypothetical protein